MEKFLVISKEQAIALIGEGGFTEEDIERAEKSDDGFIGRIKKFSVNDGTIPLYLRAESRNNYIYKA